MGSKPSIRIRYHEALQEYLKDIFVDGSPNSNLHENTIEITIGEQTQTYIKIPDLKSTPETKCQICEKKKLIHTRSNLKILGVKNPNHNFESIQQSPKHQAYYTKDADNKKIMKYCYIQLPSIRLGICNGKDGDKPCNNYKKIQHNLSKTTKTQGARHDLEESQLVKDLYHAWTKKFSTGNPDIEDEYTDYKINSMIPEFEREMQPENLLEWIERPNNWTNMLEKLDKKPKLSENKLKELFIEYIFYYWAQYTHLLKRIEELTPEDKEKILESNPKELKNWVSVVGELSGWDKEEYKERNKLLRFTRGPRHLDKPKKTDPVHDALIPQLFYYLFLTISLEVKDPDF